MLQPTQRTDHFTSRKSVGQNPSKQLLQTAFGDENSIAQGNSCKADLRKKKYRTKNFPTFPSKIKWFVA